MLVKKADSVEGSISAEVAFKVHRSPAAFAVARLQQYLKGGPQPANRLHNREVVLVLPTDAAGRQKALRELRAAGALVRRR
jgi:hypothetical protein